MSAAGKGKHIGNLVSLQPGETVRTMVAVRNLEEEGKFIFFATRNGTVKKSDLSEFIHVLFERHYCHWHRSGRRIGGTRLTDGKQIVFLASHDGMAVRFDEADVRPMGRTAYGVRGINLDEGDYVVGMATTAKVPSKPKRRRRVKAAAGVK